MIVVDIDGKELNGLVLSVKFNKVLIVVKKIDERQALIELYSNIHT